MKRTYDLVKLGGADDIYDIEGIGKNYLLIRPNKTGLLTLCMLDSDKTVQLYKTFFADDPMQLDLAEDDFIPRGDWLEFLGEEEGVLTFQNNSHYVNDSNVYKYLLRIDGKPAN